MDAFLAEWDKQLPSKWVRVETETHGVLVFKLTTYDSENQSYIGSLDLETTEKLNQPSSEYQRPIIAIIRQVKAVAGQHSEINIVIFDNAAFKLEVNLE